MSRQIYIVLRMRGEPYYGFQAADNARDRLLGLGLNPVSPADLDRANGFDPTTWDWAFMTTNPDEYDWNSTPAGFDLQAAIARDNEVIDDPETEAIYVVHERISESSGGMAEIERAMKRGKIVLFDTMSDDEILHALGLAKPPVALTTFVAGQFAANATAREAVLVAVGKKGAFASLTPEQKKDILEGKEIRVTDPSTGAGTSMRLARFDLIPQDILWEFAELYGRGAVKHGDSNMEGGYPWSWSFQKALRHLSKFWIGEDTDAETRILHVLQAAWHCFTLAWFIRHGKGTDDRPKM